MEEVIFDTLRKFSFNPEIVKSDKKHLIMAVTILAKPSSKLEKISPGPNGEMIVHVKAKPVDGAANLGIVKLLSKFFGVPQNNISVKSGEKSKTKKLILTFIFSDTKDENFFREKFISSIRKIKMKKLLVFLTLINNSLAGEASYSEQIEKLSKMKPDNYSSEINEINVYFDKFIERKNFLCQGEISTQEKKKCKDNLYELKVNYFNAIFIARKNYLNYLHNRRLQELEEEKQSILANLN